MSVSEWIDDGGKSYALPQEWEGVSECMGDRLWLEECVFPED